jgi:aspartyl-tRNA(Asn)/glutamyl-tRNA(Gln) amidotransferase subunit C
MAISEEEVRHVARLARLDLTDDEVDRFRGQLDAVLERARRIQSLALDDVPPTAHPLDVSNVLRPDEVVPPREAAEIVEAAPEREGPFFKVPRILEDEG